jgi:hypothetical protein
MHGEVELSSVERPKGKFEEGVKVDANGYKVPTTFVGSLEDENRIALYIPNHGSPGGSR